MIFLFHWFKPEIEILLVVSLQVELLPSVPCEADEVMKHLAAAKVGTRPGCFGVVPKSCRVYLSSKAESLKHYHFLGPMRPSLKVSDCFATYWMQLGWRPDQRVQAFFLANARAAGVSPDGPL